MPAVDSSSVMHTAAATRIVGFSYSCAAQRAREPQTIPRSMNLVS
jgi:hypothetical protein